jgi:alkanesulfonate monooxygenase SsuD/methylene tetrahydromethanopterin reductase-like flavin-dependent oxidoreductase (luciferase family)
VAAAATTRVRLGTCVLQLPLRQPAAVAKQATALQVLSGGRFLLGLGVGSHEPEYVNAGVDFHRRGRLMDEGVARLHAAWDAPADYVQAPAGPPVPLWFGGASAAARRRAAAVGDGWIPLFVTPSEFAESLAALRLETEEAGRDPEGVEPAVVVFACVGDDDEAQARGAAWLAQLYRLPAKSFRRHLVAGPPEVCAAELARFADAGARHIAVMVAGSPALEHFACLRTAYDGDDGAAAGGAGAPRVLAGVPA